ncbi:MAG: hypothetical protein WC810_27530 [Janthinobacterium sp.]|jgi:hypothetical protein
MNNHKLESANQESTDGKELTDFEFNSILEKYKESIEIPPTKPTKQWILCAIGLVGAGKTTVIKPLSQSLNLVRISTDEIRRILLENGYNLLRTIELAKFLTKKFLDDGYSLALDGDSIAP